MNVLLLAEMSGDSLVRDATAKAVKAVSPLGAVTLLCAGANVTAAADEAAKIEGVSKVLTAEADGLAIAWLRRART